jgi:hypothetical protein
MSNTKYPLHLSRNKDGHLIYTVDPFTGIYNDVDIIKMLKDGYN